MNTFFNFCSQKEPAKLSVSDFDQQNIFDHDIFEMPDDISINSKQNSNIMFINNDIEGIFTQTICYEEYNEQSFGSLCGIPFFVPKFDEILPPMILPKKKDISWNTKKRKIKKPSDYKNHSRNLINIIINSLEEFKFQMETICSNLQIDSKFVINHFIKSQSEFTSVKAVKDSWTVSLYEDDLTTKTKLAFKRYCSWFIKKKMMRYIIKEGKMKEKRDYLKYKTRIFSRAVKNPELFNCNFFTLLKN